MIMSQLKNEIRIITVKTLHAFVFISQKPVFFLMIFLITLAGGLWLRPFGPYYMGIFWLPFVTVGIIGSVLLFLAAPKRPPANREETKEMLDRIRKERQIENTAYLSFTVVMRVLAVLLAAAVVLAYLLRFFG